MSVSAHTTFTWKLIANAFCCFACLSKWAARVEYVAFELGVCYHMFATHPKEYKRKHMKKHSLSSSSVVAPSSPTILVLLRFFYPLQYSSVIIKCFRFALRVFFAFANGWTKYCSIVARDTSHEPNKREFYPFRAAVDSQRSFGQSIHCELFLFLVQHKCCDYFCIVSVWKIKSVVHVDIERKETMFSSYWCAAHAPRINDDNIEKNKLTLERFITFVTFESPSKRRIRVKWRG